MDEKQDKEQSRVVAVCYNPQDPSNKELYVKIAQALGTSWIEVDPHNKSKDYRENLEEKSKDKSLVLMIYDDATYETNTLIEHVRKISWEKMIEHGSKKDDLDSICMVYNGKSLAVGDVMRLCQYGFDWVFSNDDFSSTITLELVKKIVERFEEQKNS